MSMSMLSRPASRLLRRTPRSSAALALAPARRLPPHLGVGLVARERALRTTAAQAHGSFEMQDPKSPEDIVRLVVVTRAGERVEVEGKVGEEHFDLLDEATEEEEDMLDEATCLTSTSRLGCQIILRKELDGMEIALPAYSRNYYVDGHVPEPH